MDESWKFGVKKEISIGDLTETVALHVSFRGKILWMPRSLKDSRGDVSM